MFYATGLRCNELRHLKVSDPDSQRMVLHVRFGKGGVPRDIALSPILLDRLRVYFRWRRPTHWLFPSKQHHDQPLDPASLRMRCRNAGKRAGIRRPVSPPVPCMRAPRTCWMPAPSSAPSRCCSGILTSGPPVSAGVAAAVAGHSQPVRCAATEAHRPLRG